MYLFTYQYTAVVAVAARVRKYIYSTRNKVVPAQLEMISEIPQGCSYRFSVSEKTFHNKCAGVPLQAISRLQSFSKKI